MRPQYFKTANISNESGIYIPFVALMLVMLFGLAGLAIDTSFLYVRKQIVQNAADAGAVKAAQLLLEDKSTFPVQESAGTHNPNATATSGHVEYYAEQVVRENLRLNGYSETSDYKIKMPQIDPTPGTGQDGTLRGKILIDASVNSKNFFIQVALPNGQRSVDNVPGTSVATNVRYRIMLVLDMSWSMITQMHVESSFVNLCKKDFGVDIDPAKGLNTRLNVLKCSAKYFVKSLGPYDSVGIVRFASRGDLDSCSASGCLSDLKLKDGKPLDTWLNDADLMIKDGSSGIEYASKAGSCWYGGCPDPDNCGQATHSRYCSQYTGAESMTLNSGDSAFVPLAGAGQGKVIDALDNIAIFGATNIAQGIRLAHQAFDHETVPARQNEKNAIVLITDGAPHGFDPVDGNEHGFDTAATPVCHTSTPDAFLPSTAQDFFNDPRKTAYYKDQEGVKAISSGNLPFTSPVCIGSKDKCTYGAYPVFEQGRRYRYIATLNEANEAMKSLHKISIYTIGLGTADPIVDATPFQDGSDDKVKLPLLAYLANDRSWILHPTDISKPSRPAFPPPALKPHKASVTLNAGDSYSWDFPCALTGNEMSSQPKGKAFSASNAADLISALEDIAKTRVSLKPQ